MASRNHGTTLLNDGVVMKEKTEKEKRLDKLIRLITELVARDYYGKTLITFESGNAVNLKKEESIKL